MKKIRGFSSFFNDWFTTSNRRSKAKLPRNVYTFKDSFLLSKREDPKHPGRLENYEIPIFRPAFQYTTTGVNYSTAPWPAGTAGATSAGNWVIAPLTHHPPVVIPTKPTP